MPILKQIGNHYSINDSQYAKLYDIIMMIKAVIFDIDGVLIDSLEANLHFFQDLMAKAGYRVPTKKEFLPIFHFSRWDAIKILTGLSKEQEIRKIWNLGESANIRRSYDLLKIPKGLDKTIKALNEKYLLGIATSRARGIYGIPPISKLQKYFKVTVTYPDTIKHKPHPEPLLLACKKLGVKPNQAVYIGDVEDDIIAGKTAGMKVILYSKTPLAKADLCTSSFTKLPELINSLDNSSPHA